MRSLIALSLLLVAGPVTLAAQDATTPICYHARPKPACGAFVFTNFGAYQLLGSNQFGGTPLREVADWGAMVNVGEKDAVGGSVFASLDQAGFLVGPTARYRRWLSASASVEVALGTPLVSSGDVQPGSVLGLVRWSPNDWFALGVRPEVLRQFSRSQTRVSLGIELGRVPGAVLTGLGAIGTYLLALAVLANSD